MRAVSLTAFFEYERKKQTTLGKLMQELGIPNSKEVNLNCIIWLMVKLISCKL